MLYLLCYIPAPRNLPDSETPKCCTHFPISCSLNQPLLSDPYSSPYIIPKK